MYVTICIGILFIVGILFSGESHANNDATGDSHEWRVDVFQSNESWPILLSYEAMQVFYQDLFLECWIADNVTSLVNLSEDARFSVAIEKGIVDISKRDHHTKHQWWSWNTNEELGVSEYQNMSIYLKPREEDYDFPMNVRIIVHEGENETYSEEHTFLIIGEPVIITYDDPILGVGIRSIYLYSFVTAAVIYGFILYDRKYSSLRENRLNEVKQNRLKEVEENRLDEVEENRLNEMEENRLDEVEENRLNEMEENRLKEVGENRLKEVGENRSKEVEDNRLKEVGENRLNEVTNDQ